MDKQHTANARIVGDMPTGYLRVELLDGPHKGSTWAMLREHHREGEFLVAYYPSDQFVAPVPPATDREGGE